MLPTATLKHTMSSIKETNPAGFERGLADRNRRGTKRSGHVAQSRRLKSAAADERVALREEFLVDREQRLGSLLTYIQGQSDSITVSVRLAVGERLGET